MFPVSWDEDRIKEEVKSAWNSEDFEIISVNYGKKWRGTSKSGIEINGFINSNRVTAFPIIYKEEIK